MPRSRTLENRRLKQAAEHKRLARENLLCIFCNKTTKDCKEVIYGNAESHRLDDEDGEATHAIHFSCMYYKLIGSNGIYCKQEGRMLSLTMCTCEEASECDHYAVVPKYFFPAHPLPPPVPEPPRVSMSALEMIGLCILCAVFWRFAVMVFVSGQ